MLNRVRERIHPQELVAARAAAEAAPLAPRPAPKVLGWGRAMLDHLNAEAPVERPSAFFAAIDAKPIVPTDWSARIDADFDSMSTRLDELSVLMESIRESDLAELVLPPLSIADFIAELDNDRGAMLADVNAERVLLAELAPFTAKAEVA